MADTDSVLAKLQDRACETLADLMKKLELEVKELNAVRSITAKPMPQQEPNEGSYPNVRKVTATCYKSACRDTDMRTIAHYKQDIGVLYNDNDYEPVVSGTSIRDELRVHLFYDVNEPQKRLFVNGDSFEELLFCNKCSVKNQSLCFHVLMFK